MWERVLPWCLLANSLSESPLEPPGLRCEGIALLIADAILVCCLVVVFSVESGKDGENETQVVQLSTLIAGKLLNQGQLWSSASTTTTISRR